MLFRLLLWLLFGPMVQIAGVPDRPDGFTAAAAAEHVLVLDNVDVFTPWLRDKLARIVSGSEDFYRKLYTGNERAFVRYRCFVGITSRTPDTLKRDDLADRLLLLPLDRLQDSQRLLETQLAASVAAMRSAFWGEILSLLNGAVKRIRRGERMTASRGLRMADWAALGGVFASVQGQEERWGQLVDQIQADQSGFLLDEDLVVEGIALWMLQPKNHGREMTARALQSELAELLFDDAKPPRDWPKSAIGFGRRLSSIRRDLRTIFDVAWGKGTEIANQNKALYRFWPKGAMPRQKSFPDVEMEK